MEDLWGWVLGCEAWSVSLWSLQSWTASTEASRGIGKERGARDGMLYGYGYGRVPVVWSDSSHEVNLRGRQSIPGSSPMALNMGSHPWQLSSEHSPLLSWPLAFGLFQTSYQHMAMSTYSVWHRPGIPVPTHSATCFSGLKLPVSFSLPGTVVGPFLLISLPFHPKHNCCPCWICVYGVHCLHPQCSHLLSALILSVSPSSQCPHPLCDPVFPVFPSSQCSHPLSVPILPVLPSSSCFHPPSVAILSVTLSSQFFHPPSAPILLVLPSSQCSNPLCDPILSVTSHTLPPPRVLQTPCFHPLRDSEL